MGKNKIKIVVLTPYISWMTKEVLESVLVLASLISNLFQLLIAVSPVTGWISQTV